MAFGGAHAPAMASINDGALGAGGGGGGGGGGARRVRFADRDTLHLVPNQAEEWDQLGEDLAVDPWTQVKSYSCAEMAAIRLGYRQEKRRFRGPGEGGLDQHRAVPGRRRARPPGPTESHTSGLGPGPGRVGQRRQGRTPGQHPHPTAPANAACPAGLGVATSPSPPAGAGPRAIGAKKKCWFQGPAAAGPVLAVVARPAAGLNRLAEGAAGAPFLAQGGTVVAHLILALLEWDQRIIAITMRSKSEARSQPGTLRSAAVPHEVALPSA